MGEEEAGETRKLFVGGVPSSAQEAELRAHFARFGEVRSVIVMRDRETGHGRGFGFVEFEDEAAAAAALGDGDKPRHFICGRVVSLSSPPPPICALRGLLVDCGFDCACMWSVPRGSGLGRCCAAIIRVDLVLFFFLTRLIDCNVTSHVAESWSQFVHRVMLWKL